MTDRAPANVELVDAFSPRPSIGKQIQVRITRIDSTPPMAIITRVYASKICRPHQHIMSSSVVLRVAYKIRTVTGSTLTA